MIKRPRQIDFFRPLTRINTWEEFNSFDNDAVPQGGNIPISQGENTQQTAPTPAVAGIEKGEKDGQKKVEIPIILAQINNKPAAAIASQSSNNNGKQIGEDIMKKRKLMQSSYIRFKPDDVWPLQEKYELADDDLFFLKDFNEQHGFAMREAELEALIVAFEMRSGRDFIRAWFDLKDDIISPDVRDKYTFNNLEKIYNYWRVKRDTIKRPLLRLHWKPDFNDKDPHVAFRPRVAIKMKLRRQTKQNDDEQYLKLGVLREEMQKCKLLIEQMRLREDIKEWQYETMSLQFVSEIYKTDRSLSYVFADEYFENAKDVDQKKVKLDERFSQIMGKSNSLKQELGRFIEQPVDVALLQQQQTGTKQSSRLEGQKKQGITGASNREDVGNSGLNHRASSSSLLKRTIDESLASGSAISNAKNGSLAGSVAAAAAAAAGLSQNGESDNEKSGLKKLTKQERKEKKLQLKHQKQINKLQGSSQATPLGEIASSQQLKEETTKKDSSNVQSQSVAEKTIKESISINLKNATNNNSNNLNDASKNQEGGIASNNKQNQEKDSGLLSSSDADLVGYLVWVLIEGGKRDLSIDKVLNLNNNQIDSETALSAYSHNAHLLNQASLKHNLARNHLQQAGGVPGSQLSQSQQLFSQSSSQQQQQQQLHSQQQGSLSSISNPYSQSLHSNQYSNSKIPLNGPNSRMSQSQQQQLLQSQQHMSQQQQQLPQQYQLPSSYQQQQQQEMAALLQQQQQLQLQKKKNLIFFKTRLRMARSGLCNIDRLFDEKDNLRYEDLCSKEANYNPAKIAEKLILLKTDQEKQSQNKLKVLSYSSNSTELYKKDYFQAMSKKYKRLADDSNANLSEESTEPLTPQAAVASDDLPVNQNLLEIENKNLKKIISQGLKEFQKRKSAMGQAGSGNAQQQQQQGQNQLGSGQQTAPAAAFAGGNQIQQQTSIQSQEQESQQQVTQMNQQSEQEPSNETNACSSSLGEQNSSLGKEQEKKQTEQAGVDSEEHPQLMEEKDNEKINHNSNNDNDAINNDKQELSRAEEQLGEQEKQDQSQQNQELKQLDEENQMQEELQEKEEEEQVVDLQSFQQQEQQQQQQQQQFPIEPAQNQESIDQQQAKQDSNLVM